MCLFAILMLNVCGVTIFMVITPYIRNLDFDWLTTGGILFRPGNTMDKTDIIYALNQYVEQLNIVLKTCKKTNNTISAHRIKNNILFWILLFMEKCVYSQF
jgi:hypothetical protein